MDCASKKLKKMDDATSIASLPQEIILKILPTLPPKSAVSFRCTSKFFHSFIPQPHFAFRILFWVSSTNLYTVDYTTEESHGRLQPTSLQWSADELRRFELLFGSSFADGKLCLFNNRNGETTILDLSTRQHISLPQTSFHPNPGCGELWAKIFSGSALGFDPVSKRYKVLKSELYINNLHHYYQGVLRVLTLGVDESWRSVATENSFLPRRHIGSVQIGGIIYLINFKINSRDEQEIVVFDIGKENLIRMIHFPYIFQHWGGSLTRSTHSSWVKLNGRLAYIFVDDVKGRTPQISVCTLDESMGPGWDRHEVPLTLEEAEIISQAESMSFTANSIGEIVFLIQAGSMSPKILIYACGTQLWRKFEINGCSPVENLSRMIVHVIEEKVRKIHQEKKLDMLVDKDLKNNYDRIELEEMVQVALLCTQYHPSHRPKMSEVVRMLEGDGLAEKWEASQRAEATKCRANEFSSSERYSDLTEDSSLLIQAMELSGPR
nr:protein NSP-INTERACTING KINASE 1 [Ipomoea batatas]